MTTWSNIILAVLGKAPVTVTMHHSVIGTHSHDVSIGYCPCCVEVILERLPACLSAEIAHKDPQASSSLRCTAGLLLLWRLVLAVSLQLKVLSILTHIHLTPIELYNGDSLTGRTNSEQTAAPLFHVAEGIGETVHPIPRQSKYLGEVQFIDCIGSLLCSLKLDDTTTLQPAELHAVLDQGWSVLAVRA